MQKRSGLPSSRARPSTLSVDLGLEAPLPPTRSPKTGPIAAPSSARFRPYGSTPAGSTGSSTFSANQELNQLLAEDAQQLAADSKPHALQLKNGSKPLVGRRQLALTTSSSVSPSPTSASSKTSMSASSTPTAATSSQTARGPRPRLASGLASGSYTSRAAATPTAASAATPSAQREVSSDSDDSDSESSTKSSGNAVSSNAAAALYASAYSMPSSNPSLRASNSSSNPSAHPSSSSPSNATTAQMQNFSFGSSTPGGTNGTPNSANGASAAVAETPEVYSPTIVAGGGIAGEKDPSAKWSNVDAFALATPKQKTGSVLVLASYLTKSPATPNPIDKVRAIFRWICECILWVPPVAGISKSLAPADKRPRGVSEASQQAKDAAKAAAESKMEAEAKQRSGKNMDDDDDDEEGGNAGPDVDVLVDVAEILRRRRASAEGLANLFLALCESCGLDCVKVEGYGKGCGLIKVAERFDETNHFWNAVKLDSSWCLIDIAWSSGYINAGKFERTFANSYFKPNPTIFALQHFPVQCHVGRRTSKQITEFVKQPDRLQFLDSAANSSSLKKAITKAQFEDAMMIERAYLDMGILLIHPVGLHTARHDTPLYTVSLQAPVTLEFIVTFNLASKPKSDSTTPQPPRFVDQCYHVSYTPQQDDPSSQRVDIQFVFPWKGTFTATVRARRINSKLLNYEDVVHYRFLNSCGLYDIRKEKDVFVGFLAKRQVVGSDHEFEHKFAVLRPLKGHFELNQAARLQLAAPLGVTRMVAVNNGRWVELMASPSGQAQGALKNRQIFEGDLKMLRFPDIQIHYKTKGQQFNLLYKFGVTEGAAAENGSGPSSSSASSSSGTMIDSEFDENKHGKIVLDSRGTCFEKRLHITNLKIGKRSAAIQFETKAGTTVKAEVRSGWNSAVKINDKIQVTQTGTKTAADQQQKPNCACPAQPCSHSIAASGAASYDIVTWEVTSTLPEPGDYSIHLFLSSAGSGVFRFALVLHLRMDDRGKAGFNLDI